MAIARDHVQRLAFFRLVLLRLRRLCSHPQKGTVQIPGNQARVVASLESALFGGIGSAVSHRHLHYMLEQLSFIIRV